MDFICSLHDALYINSTEEDAAKDQKALESCMNRACRDVLGDAVKIGVDPHVYDSSSRYIDGRGKEMLAMLEEKLLEMTKAPKGLLEEVG